MKSKTILRVVSVAFALSMLTGYVVYSQKQQGARVAPSSKLVVLAPNERFATNNTNAINVTNVAASDPDVFAFSSKSAAPLVKIPFAPATNVSAGKSTRIAPGSKSAPVFDWSPDFDWAPPKQEVATTNARSLKTNAVKSTRR